VVLSALSFTACSDEDPEMMDNGNGGPGGSGVFKVNFDERQYIVNNGDEGQVVNAAVTGNVISINATDTDTQESFSITFTGNRKGTYNATSVTYTGPDGVYTNIHPTTGVPSGIIKLENVSTASHTISGFFSFIGYKANGERMPFFNGIFENIIYTGSLPEPLPETPVGDAYFRAKVAGVQTDFPVIMSQSVGGNYMFSATNAGVSSVMQLIMPTTANNVGTFPIVDSPFDGITVVYTAGMTTSYAATEGSITLEAAPAGWIKGKFNFIGVTIDDVSIEITDGEFLMELP
jgi:hypothetical protein